ncbi:zinc ribbon domain-containing protein [Streptococcus australis]|jgi:hypothetical membrane-anchored protein|uniref:zinc ribbon domain-containing protein n=1 Tax=Streptococcus australis TaxID=113107 RepID=UPI0039C1A79A
MKPYRRYFLALYGKMEKKKMGFCIKCGHALAEGAHFCGNCGVAIGEAHTESEQRKSVYDGELHKCPNCAEMLNSFMSSCPSCGYELRGSKSKSRVDELATKLELAESAEQKISIIRNFYVPNTKEDIYEFVILATSNMNSYDYDYEAWEAKLQQAYQKATLSFGDTQEFHYIHQLYTQTQKHKRQKVLVTTVKKSKKMQFLLTFTIGLIIISIAALLENALGKGNALVLIFSIPGTLLLLGSFLLIPWRKRK